MVIKAIINTKSNRWLAICTFLISLSILFPNIRILEQHGDEKLYVWKAAYYGTRVINWDLSAGTDAYLDPGFNPFSFWAWEQPFGSHVIYALAMAITSSPSPALPYSYEDSSLQGPETDIPLRTLVVTRFAAILCASIGLALITWHFGWKAAIPVFLLLSIPATRDSFSRAWAEGPLMLGFGLCAISYRTRWFPVALGIATAFKLTALGLWPLMFLTGSCGREFPWRRSLSLLISIIVFSILTPVSWFAYGPVYLIIIIYQRIITWYQQSQAFPTIHGVFFPSRYAWPFELLAFLAFSHFIINLIEKKLHMRSSISTNSKSDNHQEQ
jgi:hypothetical protein